MSEARPKTRRRAWLERIGLLLLGLAFSLFLCEVLARIVYPLPQETVRVEYLDVGDPNPWAGPLGEAPRPNSVTRFVVEGEYDTRYEVNSRGLRGPERDYAKADGVYRILVIGDSYVEAIQVPYEDTFYQQMELALNAADSARTYEVLGMGVGSWGAAQAYLFYQLEGQRYDPDLVIYAFHVNDPWDNDWATWFPTRAERPTYLLQDGQLVYRDAGASTGNDALAQPSGPLRAIDLWLIQHSNLYVLLRDVAGQLVPGLGLSMIREVHGQADSETDSGDESASREIVNPADVPADEIDRTPRSEPYAVAYTPLYEDAWTLQARIMAAFAEAVRSNGSAFAVVSIPAQEAVQPTRKWVRQGNDPARVEVQLATITAGLDVPFFPLLSVYTAALQNDPAPLYGTRDEHLNLRGYHLTGQAIAGWLLDQAWFVGE